ncbi:MAG: hypothetical protein V4592_19320 [Bacteroidota bacterium]
MFKKHTILIGIIIALLLLVVATQYYPGGSQVDKNSVGFSWRQNYLSNLFGDKAVNGAPNTSRPWADAGMFFLSVSIAWFFTGFSKKIPAKRPANIIRYFGIGATLCAFLAVTPYHDIMVTMGCTLVLVSLFYTTVFIFKSKLTLFKVLSVACLLVFYSAMYIYYTRSYLGILPTLQKLALALTVSLVLGLQYFTTVADFEAGKEEA